MTDDTLATGDVVVIGAGIVGLTTAWELTRRGFQVVLVDQRFVSFGASGRNPGSIWLQTRRDGLELDIAQAGKTIYDEYVAELGDVFDYRHNGGLFFFENDAQGEVLAAHAAARAAAGLDVQVITRAEALGHSPLLPETAVGAVYCADDAQIDTHQFLSALSAACVRRGVLLFENTAVLSTLRNGDQVEGVRTVRGTIYAPGVVWATGAWAANLTMEGIDASTSTLRYGQVMTQPVGRGASAIMHGPRGVYGCGALTDLPEFVPGLFAAPGAGLIGYDDTISQNRGGSVYIGHSIDGRRSLNPHITLTATDAMVGLAGERFSGAVSELGITGLWAGLSSETPDQLPIVDRADDVHVNVGHAWGIASAPVAARTMANLISGEADEFAGRLGIDRLSLASGHEDEADLESSQRR